MRENRRGDAADRTPNLIQTEYSSEKKSKVH